MKARDTKYLTVEECVDHIINVYGNDIKLGMPLGLGKPVPLINAIYNRAKNNPQIKLTIFTALSLEKPTWSNDLERRLLEPFVNRVWEGVPDLDYMLDMRKGELPENIVIHEIFCKAGAYRNEPKMQQNYMSSNYTHTVRDCASYENNIYLQLIAKNETENGPMYSAGCNADCFLEAVRGFAQQNDLGDNKMIIGVVNSGVPFMYGDAEVTAGAFDIIINDSNFDHDLFSTPRQPINPADFMIGLHISSLIKDGGTLQIGIGALGDAIAYGLDLRHNNNDAYRNILENAGIISTYGDLIDKLGGTGTLEQGLYGSTEMLVDGFLQLYKKNVIKRKVYHHIGIQRLINEGKLQKTITPDILSLMIEQESIHPYILQKEFDALQHFGVFKESLTYENGYIVDGETRYSANLIEPENLNAVSANCLGTELKNGILLTGGFFIGPRDFYDALNEMPETERQQFEMTGVEVANQLYGNEVLRALQRKDGRFCNTGMKATLLGGIVSDGLEDGTVISGVGGQYNFVSMAHALPDGRLLMMIKSTRQENGKTLSNILYNYGHVTIPRHLRDIVITEYGIADIRGKCDQDIIKAMLNVTDSRFQEELLAEAKQYKKIPEDYEIPEQYKNNTPERLVEFLNDYKAQGLFPDFPFGTEFTQEELLLAFSLKVLKSKSAGSTPEEMAAIMQELPSDVPENVAGLMDRMQLVNPSSPEEKQAQKTLLLAFRLAGFC